jgi:hypothetical protein
MADNGFGGDFVTVTDDEGNNFELEHLDTIEVDGKLYMAFLPADTDEDDPDYGTIILRVEDGDGEDMLSTVDDEDELNHVYDVFLEQVFGGDDEDDDDGDGDALT